MDILDLILNFLNLTDSNGILKKNWTIFTNKNEYPWERIKSFISFSILILTYLTLIIGITYLISKSFIK